MLTALIVEDHQEHADLASDLVRLREFNPVVAATGAEGIRLAAEIGPDVILLDLMLPDVNGFDVCQKLRTLPTTRTTPVVMVTALGDDHNRRRGFWVGANAYVTKPYGAEDLFKAIETAMAWRKELRGQSVQGEIHVQLNSEPIFLQDVNEFLTSLFRETPFSSEQIMQLRQALMEMGQNAIEWGNKHRVDATGRDHLPAVRRPRRDRDQRPGSRLRSEQPAPRGNSRRPAGPYGCPREARTARRWIWTSDQSRNGGRAPVQ